MSHHAPGAARPPRWAVAIIPLLVVAAVGTWWAKREPDLLRLGDRGRVTAEVDDACIGLSIHHDGLTLTFHHTTYDDEAPPPLPVEWRGQRIEGRLHLDRRIGGDGVQGTFTADDGTEVIVAGGGPGSHVFFTADCSGWPPYPR